MGRRCRLIPRTIAVPQARATLASTSDARSSSAAWADSIRTARQSYQQWSLLQEVSQALDAFYAATVQLGVGNQVTTFTLSDFGRTLQPSGTGCDHGWGNHHLIVGGAVKGGSLYGKFPLMTNYAAFNA